MNVFGILYHKVVFFYSLFSFFRFRWSDMRPMRSEKMVFVGWFAMFLFPHARAVIN